MFEVCRKPMNNLVQFQRETYLLLTGHRPFNAYYNKFALRDVGVIALAGEKEMI